MDIEISTDKKRLNLSFIHGYLTNSYWAKGIPLDVVEKSINHSFCFGVYKGEQQLGFARVMTDFTTFAYLADLFIEPQEHGQGYGKTLVAGILNHPELSGLKRWHLLTGDAHELYKQFGFQLLEQPGKHMEKFTEPSWARR